MESGKRNDPKMRRSTRAEPQRSRQTAGANSRRTAKEQVCGAAQDGLERRSDRIIAFIEKLRIPSGFGQGQNLILEEWQKQEIRNIYDPVDERGVRKVRRALLSVARKNGKTALAAALVLVHLLGPEAKVNGEVYSAASDREQASHIYKTAKQMIELDPELSAMCKCIDTVKRIVVYHLGSFYRSLAADARRQHGFNPSFVIYDELAQAKDRELYDVLSTSFGAQEEALLLVISTQSSDPESVMTELCDDAIKQQAGELDDPHFYGRVYAVPDDADIWDERNWKLANPALGTFRSLTDLRALAYKAKRSPAAEAAFRNLYLNQRVDGVHAFVTSTDWKACDRPIPDSELIGARCFGGLDLSSRKDLTSLELAFELSDGRVAVRSYFWTPQADIEEREKLDGAHYRVWQQRGFLEVVEGRSIPLGFVAKRVAELNAKYDIECIYYDRWRIHEFRLELQKIGIDEDDLTLLEHGQGFKDMAPAIDNLEDLIISGRLCHDGNPVLTYCMSNVKLTRDEAGNRKFDKRKKNRRIDGAVALAMATSAITRAEIEEKPGPSVYEKRGILVF